MTYFKNIKARFEDEQFHLRCREQIITIPAQMMHDFVLAVEGIYYLQIKKARIEQQKREAEAERLVAEAGHPDVLPFTDKTKERPHQENVLPSPEEPPPKLKEVARPPKDKRKGDFEPPPKHEKFR